MKDYFPFYSWLLPVIWGVCSYLHHYYPGDENGMWLISSIAGLWIAPFAFLGEVSKEAAAGGIAVAGALVMLAIGIAMDFFRVRKLLWTIIFVICSLAVFAAAIFSFPSIQRAISKHGSIWAYVFFSINIGIYISIILSAIATVIARITKYVQNNQIC
ncbi:MAG: hypothetical protein PVH77_05035 [Phycisphaerales bacterium]|jgi:hypothetical protein